MQYLDYTQWQADLQDSSEARISQHFWRNLECDQDGCVLPMAKGVQTFASACEVRTLDDNTAAALNRLVNDASADGESIICAAWAAYCSRLAEINSEFTIAEYS